MPNIVIIGGGFGGLYTARALADAPVRITLVDRRNFHLFQALLYEVASAALNPADIASPIRSILNRQKNVEVILGDVTSIDVDRKRVILADGELSYDYVVVATGATHSYFNHPEWERDAPGLKTIEDALEIRRRVLLAFEHAERETDPEAQRAWLTFVVVGGGPTGVELAGALSEIARKAMIRDFHHIDPANARVILVEARDRVLPTYPPSLSKKAERQLERLGVEVITRGFVTDLNDQEVRIDETTIPARTVLWAAGVQASPLAKSLGAPLDAAGRVEVEPDLTIPGHPEVFVIGDLAAVKQQNGELVPGVAPAAIQEGRFVAKIIKGGPRKAFRYRDKGTLATIGREAAVADLGFVKLSGFLAWIAWLTIHIFVLIGFRNRVLVMMQWAWAYFTRQRGARLITNRP